ncbi:sigma-70 family RNA polymerase sigma factor [Nocardioides caricicola]|uniref:RNA polymerase sigma factor n=1 Tax=Nocardioides caricicola TaxID=634770 RepID=A0ABW0N0Q4_9ACTN
MGRPLTEPEFEQLYRSTVRDLVGYLRRRGSADPENDAAEVYAVAWRRRADLPATLLRRAWLFGAAAKVLQAGQRHRAQEGRAAAELAQQPQEPALADDPATAVMAAAMARLSPGEREVLRLVEWERLTPAELATALGVRPGTARVRLHRARQALARDPEVRALIDRRQVAAAGGSVSTRSARSVVDGTPR